MTEYIPILATISGALIAIIGGILLHKTNDSLAKSSNKRRITREKLEETYRLSLELGLWAIDTLKLPSQRSEDNARENRIDEIILLTSCYSESCLNLALSLKSASDSLRAQYFEFLQYIIDNDDKPPLEIYAKIKEPFETLQTINEQFQKALVEEVRANR